MMWILFAYAEFYEKPVNFFSHIRQNVLLDFSFLNTERSFVSFSTRERSILGYDWKCSLASIIFPLVQIICLLWLILPQALG